MLLNEKCLYYNESAKQSIGSSWSTMQVLRSHDNLNKLCLYGHILLYMHHFNIVT